MKPLLIAIYALFMGGCAIDTPPAEEVGGQVQRGLSGQGKIVPLERSEDPTLNPPVTKSDSPNP